MTNPFHSLPDLMLVKVGSGEAIEGNGGGHQRLDVGGEGVRQGGEEGRRERSRATLLTTSPQVAKGTAPGTSADCGIPVGYSSRPFG